MQAKNRDFSRFSKDFFQNLNHFSVKLGLYWNFLCDKIYSKDNNIIKYLQEGKMK